MKYTLQVSSGEKTPVNTHELTSFRFADGSAFSASYVDFARQFGYGITCGEFMIYIPMGDYCDSFLNQSKAIKNTYCDVLENPDEMDIYITDFSGLGFVKTAGNLYELIEKMTNPEYFRKVFPRFRKEALPATFKPLQKYKD